MSFTDFWTSYPKRKGSNPKAMAEKKYVAAIKSGTSASQIICAVKRYAEELRAQKLLDTPYVCMAMTWLNQQRWLDYEFDPDWEAKEAILAAKIAATGWRWTGQKWEKFDVATHEA